MRLFALVAAVLVGASAVVAGPAGPSLPVAAVSRGATGTGSDLASVERFALAGVDQAALTSLRRFEPAAEPDVLTPRRVTAAYALVGVTWRASSTAPDMTVRVRTRGLRGWSSWRQLDVDGVASAPRGGLAPADDTARTRSGTEPLYAGPSTGVQVRVDSEGVAPPGLRVELVHAAYGPADDAVSTGRSTVAGLAPRIHTRAEWGADESKRSGFAGYGTTIKAGWVHHTVNTNSYSAAEVPAMIRAIYAYHTGSLGWSDIGYNILVDRFGRSWEGRWGGVDKPVIGAHTRGYNTNTVGVAALGDHESGAAPDALIDAFGDVMGWKLGMYGRDPRGRVTLTSGASGSDQKYQAGQSVTLPVISGHRDVIYTLCPGRRLYARLGDIRDAAAAWQGPLSGKVP